MIDFDNPNVNVGTININVPIGYVPIELTTGGKLNVPRKVNIRNFTTAELIDLSMYEEDMIPERIILILNSLIFEKVDTALWPDSSIIELLVRHYANFYTPYLMNVRFPITESDIEFLKDSPMAEDLKEGRWVPRIDLDLRTVKVDALSDDIKTYILINKKGTNPFKAKFLAYPRYGDTLEVKKVVERKFKDREKKFAELKQQLEIREAFLYRDKDISDLKVIDDDDFRAYQELGLEKNIYLAKATQALYLASLNDEDLLSKTIDEKVNIIDANKHIFDANLGKALQKQFNKITFGVNPEVEVKNPITSEVCKRNFNFRVMDILQAIRLFDSDGYDISYDD